MPTFNTTTLAAYALARLREGSTWRGLFTLRGAGGLLVPEPTIQAISAAGVAIAGLLGALLPDPAPPTAASQPPAHGV